MWHGTRGGMYVRACVCARVQAQKTLRKTLRRLESSLNKDETGAPLAAATVDETGRIVRGPRVGLAHLKAALAGPADAAREALDAATAEGAPGRERVLIRGAVPVSKRKKLRYTFNTSLRDARLAGELEDETDDEEDVRLGRVAKPSAEEDVDMEDGAADAAGDVVESSGVHKAADKPVRKRENGPKYLDNFRDGCPGLFDTDPALTNPRRAVSHRKGRRRAMDSEALGALASEPTEPGTDDLVQRMLNPGRGQGAKAAYKFWNS